MDEDSGRCAHCGKPLPSRAGGGRRRQYCDATCRSAARRARTPTAAWCSVRAGTARCAGAADGRWHDTRGTVIAWTCAAHRDLAGELARAGLPAGRKLDRWLPAAIAWRPVPPAVTGPAYTLTVRLEDVHPPVWRQVQVPAASTLADLHEVIQVAMGWDNAHLWQFGPILFGEVRGEYDKAAALDDCLAKPGDTLGYLYDLGDMWHHRVTLDRVTARPRSPLPRCLAGRRAWPAGAPGRPARLPARGLRRALGLRGHPQRAARPQGLGLPPGPRNRRAPLRPRGLRQGRGQQPARRPRPGRRLMTPLAPPAGPILKTLVLSIGVPAARRPRGTTAAQWF